MSASTYLCSRRRGVIRRTACCRSQPFRGALISNLLRTHRSDGRSCLGHCVDCDADQGDNANATDSLRCAAALASLDGHQCGATPGDDTRHIAGWQLVAAAGTWTSPETLDASIVLNELSRLITNLTLIVSVGVVISLVVHQFTAHRFRRLPGASSSADAREEIGSILDRLTVLDSVADERERLQKERAELEALRNLTSEQLIVLETREARQGRRELTLWWIALAVGLLVAIVQIVLAGDVPQLP